MTAPGDRESPAGAVLADLRRRLRRHADPADAKFLQGYFKTGPGEYAEGDRFLGIRVPVVRSVARAGRALPLRSVLGLLRSKWHEERLLALLILVERYRRGDARDRDAIVRAYLAGTDRINNWDLVDVSAGTIVGGHLAAGGMKTLERLARSSSVWERRIAVIATSRFIREGVYRPTLRIAAMLIDDPEDLIHKAAGWMLREVGKRDRRVEEAFLAKHYRGMPRTMLRYAVERFPERRRQAYLKGRV